MGGCESQGSCCGSTLARGLGNAEGDYDAPRGEGAQAPAPPPRAPSGDEQANPDSPTAVGESGGPRGSSANDGIGGSASLEIRLDGDITDRFAGEADVAKRRALINLEATETFLVERQQSERGANAEGDPHRTGEVGDVTVEENDEVKPLPYIAPAPRRKGRKVTDASALKGGAARDDADDEDEEGEEGEEGEANSGPPGAAAQGAAASLTTSMTTQGAAATEDAPGALPTIAPAPKRRQGRTPTGYPGKQKAGKALSYLVGRKKSQT